MTGGDEAVAELERAEKKVGDNERAVTKFGYAARAAYSGAAQAAKDYGSAAASLSGGSAQAAAAEAKLGTAAADTAKKIDEATQATTRFNEAAKRWQDASGKFVSGPGGGSSGGGTSGFLTDLIQAEIVTHALTAAWQELVSVVERAAEVGAEFIGNGVNVNSQLEVSQRSIAALIATYYEFKDAQGNVLEGNAALDAAMAASKGVIEDLRVAAAKTPLTFEELLGALQTVTAQAGSAGIQIKDLVPITTNLAGAVKVLGLNAQQVQQELRALLSGNVGPDATLANALKIKQAEVEQWRQEGTLIDNINERLQYFNLTAARSAENFDVLVSNVGDVYDLLSQQATEKSFASIKEIVARGVDAIIDPVQGKLRPEIQAIVDLIDDSLGVILTRVLDIEDKSIDGVKRFGEYARDNRETLVQTVDSTAEFAEQFVGLGIAAGELQLAMWGVVGLSGNAKDNTESWLGVIKFLTIGVAGVRDLFDTILSIINIIKDTIEGATANVMGRVISGLELIIGKVEYLDRLLAAVQQRERDEEASIDARIAGIGWNHANQVFDHTLVDPANRAREAAERASELAQRGGGGGTGTPRPPAPADDDNKKAEALAKRQQAEVDRLKVQVAQAEIAQQQAESLAKQHGITRDILAVEQARTNKERELGDIKANNAKFDDATYAEFTRRWDAIAQAKKEALDDKAIGGLGAEYGKILVGFREVMAQGNAVAESSLKLEQERVEYHQRLVDTYGNEYDVKIRLLDADFRLLQLAKLLREETQATRDALYEQLQIETDRGRLPGGIEAPKGPSPKDINSIPAPAVPDAPRVTASLGQITSAAFKAAGGWQFLGQSAGAAIAAMINGSATGAQAIRQLVFGLIGDIMIQMGTAGILAGTLANAAPFLFGLTGGAAIAAGIALVVAGNAVKALGGGGGGSASVAAGGGSADVGSAAVSATSSSQRRTRAHVFNTSGEIDGFTPTDFGPGARGGRSRVEIVLKAGDRLAEALIADGFVHVQEAERQGIITMDGLSLGQNGLVRRKLLGR